MGYRAKAIPLARVRHEWKRILNDVEAGSFVFVTAKGVVRFVMTPPLWYRQITAAAHIQISVTEAELAVLRAWQEAVGTEVGQLINRALFGTGVPRSPTPGAIYTLLQRVRRVAQRASSALESRDHGWAWLMEPLPALGGKSPISLLADDAGEKQVLNLVASIEHGIPA